MTATASPSDAPPAPGSPVPGIQLNEYQLRLPGFEGPLDVLLRLIEREQLPIAELSLVQVTDQFLAAMRGLDRAAPALIADFAAVGARLALLKSRSLLPRPPVATDEPEPGDLVQQLLRYREFKEAAKHLAARDGADHAAFAATTRALAGEAARPVRLADHAPAALVRVIRRRLTQIAEPARVYATRRVVSLREMVVTVAGQLLRHRTVRFSRIASECQDRLEVQTAFLAGLVLVRRGMADADQPELFGEITFRALSTTSDEFQVGLAGDVAADFDPEQAADAPDPARVVTEPLAMGAAT